MFFVRFIISNIFGAILVGIILLLKKLLKNKTSLRFQYHIWLVLLLSLSVVFLPTAYFQPNSFNSVTPKIAEIKENTSENTLAAPDMPKDWQDDFTEIVNVDYNAEISTVFAVVWCIGMLGTIFSYYIGNRKLRRIKRFSELPLKSILNIFDDCRKKVPVSHKVCLLQSDMINSPLCFGWRTSYIILPKNTANELSQGEIEHILLHELTHIKNKDVLVNFLLCAEQVLYWPNPLVWWAFGKIRRDREAFCDWSVLNMYKSDEERLCYGDTLLRFASQKNIPISYTASSLFHNKKELKYRIERIVEFKNESNAKKVIGRSFIIAITIMAMVQAPVFSAFASDFGLSYNPKEQIKAIEQDYSDLFGNINGCAVVYNMQSNIYNVYNKSEITKRVAPCSTCKIYSAVNALEQGVITPSQNTIKWDNLLRDIPSWNSNQNLSSALKNSVNWYFQYLDNAVGADELERFYKSINYGNWSVGNDTAYYWNGGNLKISPLEQVELLVKLYNNQFGFDQLNTAAVKDAIFILENSGNKLYGKTGTGKIGNNDVNGWFIGYAETPNNTYFIAVNLQDKSKADGKTAANIAYTIFERMGIKLTA